MIRFPVGKEKTLTAMRIAFILILAINLLIAADLFQFVLSSPAAVVVIRLSVMGTVLAFLAAQSIRHPQIIGRGWYFVLAGFLLLLLAPLASLLSRIAPTAAVLGPPGSRGLELFQEVFCRLFGFFLLAYGFFLWIPSVIQARRRAEQSAELLERKVAERTASLDRTNRELALSKQRLEESARLKNEFLASFSHELKTPLNSILGFCRLLAEERQGPLNDKQRKSIRIIDENGKALLERISRILDFAGLEFGKVAPEFRSVDVDDLVAETAASFEPQLAARGLELEVRTGCGSVRTDDELLGQVLQAALDNAIKFTERGKIKLETVRDPGGRTWSLVVSDTGQGMDPRDIPGIFDAFRQSDGSLSRSHGGTGLGLTIARRLTDLLRGDIEVDSETGRGSTFRFRFPVDPLPHAEDRAGAAADAAVDHEHERRTG